MRRMQTRIIAAAAAALLALGVGCGAFGAHALRDSLSPADLQIWEKAVLYHLVHGLAALVIASIPSATIGSAARARLGALMLGSVLVFSGSLYVLVLSGMRWLGMVTPLGGMGFIIGWLLLAYQLVRDTKQGCA